ncbi:unnamed protein product [Victoria cruziana]
MEGVWNNMSYSKTIHLLLQGEVRSLGSRVVSKLQKKYFADVFDPTFNLDMRLVFGCSKKEDPSITRTAYYYQPHDQRRLSKGNCSANSKEQNSYGALTNLTEMVMVERSPRDSNARLLQLSVSFTRYRSCGPRNWLGLSDHTPTERHLLEHYLLVYSLFIVINWQEYRHIC